MNKQYKVGDEVLVRGIVNSEVRNGGIHVLHDGIDAFYMLDQIHEPQKVVVPKFVAEWIEELKKSRSNLAWVWEVYPNEPKIKNWLESNTETFMSAWLFGYEIEREKLYTVEIPNPNKIGNEVSALMMNGFRQVVIKKEYGNDWKKEKGFQLTEKEIKKDFDWAWQFAKEVE